MPALATPVLRRLIPYYRPYRRPLVIGLTLVVVSSASASLIPWLLRAAIDAISGGAPLRRVLALAGGMLGVALVTGAIRFWMRELLNGMSRWIEFDLRNALFAKLTELDAEFYAGMRTGEIMARLTNDIGAVRQAVGPAVMYLTNTIFGGIFALVFMLRIDVRLTLLALAPMVLLPIVMARLGRAIHARFEAVQQHFGTLTTLAQENLAGVRVVRAYRQEAPELARFTAHSAEYVERNMALARLYGMMHPATTALAGAGALVVLSVGGGLALRGTITVGAFVAFGMYLGMLTWPLIALGWVTNLFQRGAASMARLLEILDARASVGGAPRGTTRRDSVAQGPAEGSLDLLPGISEESRQRDSLPAEEARARGREGSPGDPADRQGRREVPGGALPAEARRDSTPTQLRSATAGRAVEFRNVSFHYPVKPGQEPRWVLRDVSFRIEAGQTLGIVGATGSGKSALLDLVPRLHDPQRGEIRIDGIPIRELPLAALRAEIGYVPQESFLFSDTIGANLGYGGASPADAEWAAGIAQLDATIRGFPGGYDTVLGERGINLSGGQKQRAALARALARKPHVVLLDDALSAVDTHTEAEILGALRHALAGRTAMIASHRISAIRSADWIIVLHEGRIVEAGRHEALIAAGGRYWALLNRQQLEESLEEEGDVLAGDAHAN